MLKEKSRTFIWRLKKFLFLLLNYLKILVLTNQVFKYLIEIGSNLFFVTGQVYVDIYIH